MLNVLYSAFSIVLLISAPEKYSYLYVLLISLVFATQAVPFLIKKSKSGFLNFYTIFFASYFFINFFYPLVLYPINPEYFSIFTYSFNHNVINKSTALALVSASFFILGASIKLRKAESNACIIDDYKISHLSISVITGVLVILFFVTVGKEFLAGNFTAHSSISEYILQLLTCCITLAAIVFFKDYAHQKNKFVFYSIALVYIVLFLRVGDRGPALSLLIVSIVLYSFYAKRISLIVIIPLAFFGVMLMHLIGEGRSAEVVTSNANIIIRGFEGFSFDIEGYYRMTHSFVVNTWTLYFGVDYAEKYGLNYGSTLISPVLGAFPFLLGTLERAFDTKLFGSALFFTYEVLGENPYMGLGTNLVADVYISFGLFGCVVLFFLLGQFIENARVQLLITHSIKSNIIYFTMISYAVYLPRASLFAPLKFIIWTYLIYILLRGFRLLKRTKV